MNKYIKRTIVGLIILILIGVVVGGAIFAYYNLLKVEKYIAIKDIKNSKFITAQMDIQGGCRMESKYCFAYFGYYEFKYENIKIPIEIIVEQHFKKVSEEDVFSVLKDKLLVKQPEKGDWMRNYFLVGEDNYGRFVIGWNSGSKLITIRGEGSLANADYFEDFLTEYMGKYPSNIRSN